MTATKSLVNLATYLLVQQDFKIQRFRYNTLNCRGDNTLRISSHRKTLPVMLIKKIKINKIYNN